MNRPRIGGPEGPLQRGTPPGSLRFFSTLFAPAAARPLLEALYAFEAELRDSVRSLSHDVAHTRLQWWRGEVDRYAAGRPQHPVTVALLGLREFPGHDPALLHELLAGADLDLARLTYASWQELEAYAFRSSGALQSLVTSVLAGDREPTPAEREFARRLGSALRQTEMLRDLALDVAQGRWYVPLEVLDAAGIDPLRSGDAPDTAWRSVVQPWRRRLEAELAGLPAGLTTAERSAQRPGLVLAALHARLLERVAAVPTDGRRADVPPWTRLWTAWTTAVRHS